MNAVTTHAPARPGPVPAAWQPPKPTLYKDVRFASRLESQWAVFFDEHGIEWAYEPHRLRLPGDLGEYLPDFFLPALGTWFEAKGSLGAEQLAKAMALWETVSAVGQRVAVGTADGRLAVPFRLADGVIGAEGACVRCSRCRSVWFANPADGAAAACWSCGDAEGGAASLAAARAALAAGIRPGWPGGFDPTLYRSLVADA